MEIVFLLAGLALVAIGVAITALEVGGRRGTEPVQARVVGFSLGSSNNPNMASFHSVAEYVAQNGRKYYIEGSVGSSVPLHKVGQRVTVLTDPKDPERAVLKSRVSYILGAAMVIMGFISIGVFWITFRPSVYSALMAVVVLGGLAAKVKSAWRKQPFSLEAWQAYKKTILPKVFTEESKGQILWADPIRVESAISVDKKTNRVVVPVLVSFGVGLLLLSYHSYGNTSIFLKKAHSAAGIVVDLKERESTDSNSTYSAVVDYRDPRGREFKFVDPLSSSPPTYHAGQTVNVLYDPENPNDAQIDRSLGNYWPTAVLGFAGVLFLAGGLYAGRNWLNRSSTSSHNTNDIPSTAGSSAVDSH